MSINTRSLGEMGTPMLVDLLKTMDFGGYYFFDFAATHHPWLAEVMLPARWVGSYGVGIVFALGVSCLLIQRRLPAVLISIGALTAGVLGVEMLRYAIAADRPANAQKLVDADEMLRSFPAREVFAFTLAATLLLVAAWTLLPNTALRLVLTAGIVALVLWVALSQLVLGLNYVSDVMAGLAGGLALTMLASRFFATPRKSGPGAPKGSQKSNGG
jgi:membrane-associated phospholipid phosphatase